ncbi:MAG: RHS repeat protein, partial [Lachnospiraceae bacterium]|nr:RHS repeat protein [Lachnospiraceae bacterium]
MGRITDWNGTGYVYDSFGRLISAKDGKGRGWSYEYDFVGNITRSVYSDGTGTAEEKYTYGRGGNLMTFGNERTGGYKGGNPGLYLGNKLTWTRGRQLSSVKHKNKKSAHSVS